MDNERRRLYYTPLTEQARIRDARRAAITQIHAAACLILMLACIGATALALWAIH